MSKNSRPILAALLAQAALQLPFPSHLPEWSDEGYTRNLARLPVEALLAAASQDVHPPLFYLMVHPFYAFDPETPIGILRLASVLLAGLTTLGFDRFWLRDLEPRLRMGALALWVLGPSWQLYARMARSYSFQCLLVVVAFGLVRPTQKGVVTDEADRWLGAGILASLALATDYVSGFALWAGLVVGLLRSRQIGGKRPEGAWFLLLPLSVVGLMAGGLWENLGKWLERAPAQLSLLNTLVGVLFGGASLVYGETIPGLGWVAAVGVTVPLAALLFRGLRLSGDLRMLVPTAILGFVGVAGWVGFSFVPARVLYLAPFLVLLALRGLSGLEPRWQRIGVGLVLLWGLIRVSGLVSYWEKRDFINGGYVVPLSTLASAVEERAADDRVGTVLVLDAYNTDAGGVLKALEDPLPTVVIDRPEAMEAVERLLEDPRVHRVLFLRNTHDLAPGALNEQAEAKLASHFTEAEPAYWLEYGWLARVGMKLLGWSEMPSHYLQLREFRR